MKIFDLVKKFQTASKSLIPRSVFMLLLFMVVAIFGSSLFMGVGVSIFSMLSGSGSFFLATAFFLAFEFFLCFCGFILQYGLFLSNLRFVRAQPVALTFLFAGFRQKRAKKFAAFFIVPLVLAFAVTMLPASQMLAAELPQSADPQTLLEYFNSHPEFLRAVLLQMFLFGVVAFVLYVPFAFVWAFVYDGTQKSFTRLLTESLKFWKGKLLNFFGFVIAANYKKALVVFACDLAQFFVLKKFSSNAGTEFISSIFGFVSFFATILLVASVILSINFYYNEHVESDENSESESSN